MLSDVTLPHDFPEQKAHVHWDSTALLREFLSQHLPLLWHPLPDIYTQCTKSHPGPTPLCDICIVKRGTQRTQLTHVCPREYLCFQVFHCIFFFSSLLCFALFLRLIYFYFACMSVACMCPQCAMCPQCRGSQKMALNPRELELQMVWAAMSVVETKPKFS